MKKLIKRRIRRSILRSLSYPLEMGMAKRYADYVFDAPMRKWLFRLRIVRQFGQNRDSVAVLEEVSAFILRGEVKEIYK